MELEVVDVADGRRWKIKAKAIVVDGKGRHIPVITSNHIVWLDKGMNEEKCNKCNMVNNFGLTERYFAKLHERCNGNILTALRLLGDEFPIFKQGITTEDINLANNFIDTINKAKITEEDLYIDGKYFSNIQLRHYKNNIYWTESSYYFCKVVGELYNKRISEASLIIAYASKGYRLRFHPYISAVNMSFKLKL